MLSSILTKIFNLVLPPEETLTIFSSKGNISKYYHLNFLSRNSSCLKIYTITSIYKFTIMCMQPIIGLNPYIPDGVVYDLTLRPITMELG